jgi:predicted HTH domain antitoxin
LTDSERRSWFDFVAELRVRGRAVGVAEEELQMEREWLAELLLEGIEQHLMMVSRMARVAGISRQTAHKLIRQAQRRRLESERFDKADRWRDLYDLGDERSPDEQAEYERLKADNAFMRWLVGDKP